MRTLNTKSKFLALAGLISVAALVMGPARLVSAQTVGLSWSSRYAHTATLLSDGKVLVAGGYNAPNSALNSAELYDPATGSWSITGNLNTAGGFIGTATLLTNGKVLVAGGFDVNHSLNSSELYDPATGT